jgi:uncharacterized protein
MLVFVLVLSALVFVLAGLVKGVIGMGLPTVAMGLLSLMMPPAQAAALLILPSTVTNVWQLLAGPSVRGLWRRLWPMMLGVCAGTWAGAGLLTDDGRASAGLGMALVIYGVLGLSGARFTVPRSAEPWLGPVTGALTGLISAATGTFVIPAVPYLQAIGLEKDDLVQALGLSFTVSTLALTVNLVHAGAFELGVAGTSLLMLVPAALGMVAGQAIRTRISPAVFRVCFFAGLVLLGLHLALRPFF